MASHQMIAAVTVPVERARVSGRGWLKRAQIGSMQRLLPYQHQYAAQLRRSRSWSLRPWIATSSRWSVMNHRRSISMESAAD